MEAFTKSMGKNDAIILTSDLTYVGERENGERVKLGKMPQELVDSILESWTESSIKNSIKSNFSTESATSKLIILSVRMDGCNSFDLRDIEILPLEPTTLHTTNGDKKVSPIVYSQRWLINACGKNRKWYIFDDGDQTELVEMADGSQ
jgi:hypothetical protein